MLLQTLANPPNKVNKHKRKRWTASVQEEEAILPPDSNILVGEHSAQHYTCNTDNSVEIKQFFERHKRSVFPEKRYMAQIILLLSKKLNL